MSDIEMDDSGDDGGIEAGDDDVSFNQNAEEDMPQEIDNSPEGLRQQAQDCIGFDDANAVLLFLQAYEAEGAEDSFKGEVICQAAEIGSGLGDVDQIQDLATKLFDARDASYVSDPQLENTVRTMLGNVQTSEEGTRIFLEIAVNRINRENLMNLYLELRIRQCEISVILGDYPGAKEILKEVTQYCPYPPDPSDEAMCRASIRILVIQIDFADRENDEKAMFEAYSAAQDLPKDTLDNRQRALLLKIEGLKAIRDNSIHAARSKFWEAFKLFDNAGSDKRISCLPYFGLASMLLHETVNVFYMPETMHFTQHPLVAPLAQLDEAYQRADIVLFNQRVHNALEIFGNDQLYALRIDDIRKYVLQKAIMKLCPVYSRVGIDFIAQSLKSDENEVKEIVLALILAKELPALIEEDSGRLVMTPQKPRSKQLTGLTQLVSSSEKAINTFMISSAITLS